MNKKYFFIAVVAVAIFGLVSLASAETSSVSNANSLRINELQAMIEKLQAQIKFLQTGVSVDGSGSDSLDDRIEFTKKFGLGEQGDDVRKLQQVLATDKTIYPEGLMTGYFGERTKEAIKRLQEKFKIEKTGTLDQATIDLINKILASQGAVKTIPQGLLIAPGLTDRVKAKMEFNNGKVEYKIELDGEKFEYKSESGKSSRLSIELEKKSGDKIKAKVDMRNGDGRTKRTFIFDTSSVDEVIKELANKLGLSESEIKSAINSSDDLDDDSDDSDEDSDDDDSDDDDDDSDDDNGGDSDDDDSDDDDSNDD